MQTIEIRHPNDTAWTFVEQISDDSDALEYLKNPSFSWFPGMLGRVGDFVCIFSDHGIIDISAERSKYLSKYNNRSESMSESMSLDEFWEQCHIAHWMMHIASKLLSKDRVLAVYYAMVKTTFEYLPNEDKAIQALDEWASGSAHPSMTLKQLHHHFHAQESRHVSAALSSICSDIQAVVRYLRGDKVELQVMSDRVSLIHRLCRKFHNEQDADMFCADVVRKTIPLYEITSAIACIR